MKLQATIAFLSTAIAVFRSIVTDEVVQVIKLAILEWTEAAEDGWQPLERTNFVIGKAREIAEVTPNTTDDVVVEILARLYIAYFIAKGVAPATSQG